MENFSGLLAVCKGKSRITREFPSQRPMTRGFDVFFDLRLNKRIDTLVIWDAIALIMTSLYCKTYIAGKLVHQHFATDTMKLEIRYRTVSQAWVIKLFPFEESFTELII